MASAGRPEGDSRDMWVPAGPAASIGATLNQHAIRLITVGFANALQTP